MSRRGARIALIAITILAFGLRVWSVGWGMPYAFHADENVYVTSGLRMLASGDFNPHYFLNPPLLTYTVMLEMLLLLAGGQLLGVFHSIPGMIASLDVDPTPIWVTARMNGVLLGTATVPITYLIARRFFGEKTSLLSALLMAVAFLPVRDSHYAVNDTPATFLLMVSFYFASRVYSTCRWRDYLLAGAFLGLATATKYNVGLGAVFIVAAHLVSRKRARPWRELRAQLPLLAAGAVSLLAFCAANPFFLLDHQTFVADFAEQYRWAADPYDLSDASTELQMLRALATGSSPAMLAMAVLGLAILPFRRWREALLLGAFPLLYRTFFLIDTSLFFARFALPLFPFIAILAAHGTERVLCWVPSGNRRLALGGLILLLMGSQPLILSVRHDSLLAMPDTRLLLGRWVEENIPPGSRIGVEGYSLTDGRGRVMGPKKIDYQMVVETSLRGHSVAYYTDNGFDYLIASSYVYGRYPLDPEAHKGAIDAYKQFDGSFTLEATFSPTADGHELPFIMDEELTPIWTVMERERPGPTIKVYRVGTVPAYGVGWLKADVPAQLSPGQSLTVPVTVSNAGNRPWPDDGYSPVRLGYRWLDASGREVSDLDIRSSLPERVAPGASATLQAQLATPASPGVYTLQMDMVQENFSWLSAKGAETKDFRVTVK